jgi:hypothetical protein
VRPSYQERMAKRSPISLWALGMVLFVVVGGGELPFVSLNSEFDNITVIFELAKLVFL